MMTTKTSHDRIDARILAKFGLVMQPQIQPLPDEKTLLLKDLRARRTQLINLRTAESNRLQQARAPKVQSSIERVLELLAEQLKSIDDDLDHQIQESSIDQKKWKLLKGVPGIGPQTCRTLLLELPELGAATRQEIATLVATRCNPRIAEYLPTPSEAGKRKKVALIACMRKLLTILNAMLRNEEPWRKSTVKT